jgi:hypothetical protein
MEPQIRRLDLCCWEASGRLLPTSADDPAQGFAKPHLGVGRAIPEQPGDRPDSDSLHLITRPVRLPDPR